MGSDPAKLDVVRHRVAARECRVLGRSIAIHDPAMRQLRHCLGDMRHRQHVASGNQLPQRAQSIDAPVHHQGEQPCRQPQRGRAVIPDRVGNLVQRRHRRRHDRQPASVQQSAPDLERGGVERQRRQMQDDLIRIQRNEIAVGDQPGDAAMRHHHPLRTASRAGGVHDISQIVGPGLSLHRHRAVRPAPPARPASFHRAAQTEVALDMKGCPGPERL